jgi:hypothetical protein
LLRGPNLHRSQTAQLQTGHLSSCKRDTCDAVKFAPNKEYLTSLI